MGKGGGTSSGEVRYAPYLEAAHSKLLDHQGSDNPVMSFMEAFNDIINNSPYSEYDQIDVNEGYFGIRTDDPSLTYEPKNYPSLWDMFGKFMGGLDIHDLWSMIYSDVIQGPEIENAVSAQSALLQDDIDTTIMPKFLGGMRDINSVQGTAFIVGKGIIQSTHIKAINKFSSAIRIRALDISNEQWNSHLKWNHSVVGAYSEIFKLYYASKIDMDRANLEYQSKNLMWDINLFENARAILGAMSGSAATKSQNEPSQGQKAVGGAMAGGAAGWMVGAEIGAVGGPVGAAIGAVIGLGASFL